jgi:serine/threonine-protein kinase
MNCIRCHTEISRDFRACPHCGEPVTDFLRRYSEEPVDGKYRLIERLGAGGMGDVYKVEHTFLGSLRVIKVIRPQISSSLDAHERFLREARLATRVQHPNVATLHDFSALPDGSHYMVWEYIEGENIAQLLRRRGSLPPRVAVRLAIEALHGLEAIHRAGIVHRDISPENIMVTRESDGRERVRIIDLGVAKIEGGDAADGNTKTGIFVGKLRYASPEHLGFLSAEQRIDGRADVYSLAIVLYEMLTGRPPFEATSPHQYILHHSTEAQFQPLPLPLDLPGREVLQTILGRALAHDRDQRFTSARDFAGALEEVARTLPDSNDTATIEEAFDPNATMRVRPDSDFRNTLQRTTHVSAVAPLAAATVRTSIETIAGTTPLPAEADPRGTTGQQSAPLPSSVNVPAATPPAAANIPATAFATPPPPPPPAATHQVPPASPAQQARPASSPSRGGRTALLVALALVFMLLVVVAAGAWFMMRNGNISLPTTGSVAAATTTTANAASQTTVDVVTSSSAPATATTVTTDSVATSTTNTAPEATLSAPAAKQITPATHSDENEAEVQPAEAEATEEPPTRGTTAHAIETSGKYVEGGDSSQNDAARTTAHRSLQGVTMIAVHASSARFRMQIENAVRGSGLMAVDGVGEATVDFYGDVERLGRGRKARSAHAKILRNGRVIFEYELPREEYRMGDDPAEAFGRVLRDIITQ